MLAHVVGRRALLDEYGATDPAEFFAVATETFFEKPKQLNARKRQKQDVKKRIRSSTISSR